jgi:hypothetical protein
LKPRTAILVAIATATIAAFSLSRADDVAAKSSGRLARYQRMDFGPALFWTLQIEQGNIAYKGIAVRLDPGAGGVSRGRAWMIYDHDTLRVAAATTGSFVDWRGIAFDGSHQSHTSLTGVRHFVNPPGPGWADDSGRWEDPRLRGRDGLPYGPLPRDWAHYSGLYLHGEKVVLSMTVGETPVLEAPGWIEHETHPVFTRTFNVGESERPLVLRVAPDSVHVHITGAGTLRQADGFWLAELPARAKTRLFISRAEPAQIEAMVRRDMSPLDLGPWTGRLFSRSSDEGFTGASGKPPLLWPQEVTTAITPGREDGPFTADTLELPGNNPWQSWMRPGGFDFLPDGKSAVLCTWNGDAWRVDGLTARAPASLRWRRLVAGLFQPLGVRVRGGEIFVCCRDQIVRLRDLNSDGEIDFIENFNNDHQVTEHFHEFAMGLQSDAAGNLYYAKSARHALPALVPHHGTLLRVSADGSRTDILATGFRAANGVCLNDDGTFFVTDQEGHWIPKNRVNRVRVGGFYGNMLGFTSVTNSADSAMDPPMVWITNAKDRSPAELLRVPEGAWGSLSGALLSLSYGTGKIFVVPHEEVGGVWQGAICELPLPLFATGIMRGRFGADGALYLCGLFGWAGNATAHGGFYRVRRNNQPAHVPISIRARKSRLDVTFSEALDPASVDADGFAFRVWSLKRSADYGSKHYNEHTLNVAAAKLGTDRRTVSLDIPDLAPTECYELKVRVRAANGDAVERSLHGTLHALSAK